MKNGYTTINLPTEKVEDLKILKMAFASVTGRSIKYAEIITSAIDIMLEGDTELKKAFKKIKEARNKNKSR